VFPDRCAFPLTNSFAGTARFFVLQIQSGFLRDLANSPFTHKQVFSETAVDH